MIFYFSEKKRKIRKVYKRKGKNETERKYIKMLQAWGNGDSYSSVGAIKSESVSKRGQTAFRFNKGQATRRQ